MVSVDTLVSVRRVGDGALARAWFDRVPGEVADPATQQWVLDAARQQRDRPREWFGPD